MGLLLLFGHEQVDKKAGQDFIAVEMKPLFREKCHTSDAGCAFFLSHNNMRHYGGFFGHVKISPFMHGERKVKRRGEFW